MKVNTTFLITGLILLLIANLCIVVCEQNGISLTKEGFVSYFLQDGAGVGSSYQPIGQFDNLKATPCDGMGSTWRYTSPNVPLQGPPVVVGPDNLFILKNNAVKPECCDASFSSDTGCVCLTPEQRNYLNTRGGNRTVEDGF